MIKRETTFRLPYRPPFDWESLVAFLGARAIGRVEAVERGEYRRTITVAGVSGLMRASPGGRDELVVTIAGDLGQSIPLIRERVRRMFDLDAEPRRIGERFAADPVLAPLIAKWPGIRVPGTWETFEVAMRAVVGQQISVAGARTILGRIAARYGTQVDSGDAKIDLVFPPASRLTRVRVGGMPASRAATIRAIAAAFASGEPTIEALSEIRGIGPWTASYLAMRGYSQRDAFPSGDLGVRKAAGGMSARELELMSEGWRPYRAYAAMLLWKSL